MKKVAKLVTLVITTRVVVDSCNSDDNAAEQAIKEIRENYADYIVQENIEKIEDDIECPYGTLTND